MSPPLPVRRLSLAVVAFLLFAALLETANAQIVRVRRGGGVYVAAPFVRVQVGPVGIPARPYVLPRRGFVPPSAFGTSGEVGPSGDPGVSRRPYYRREAQVYGGGSRSTGAAAPTPAYSSGATASPQISDEVYPTVEQLQQMDAGALLNTLVDLTIRLDDRLSRFDTGRGWQRHLGLPDDALPPPTASGEVTLGMMSIQTTLARFDAVAANPEYAVIHELPVFIATRAALQEVVNRYGGQSASTGPQLFGAGGRADDAPTESAAEVLPPPEPSPSSVSPTGIDEGQPRSILKQ